MLVNIDHIWEKAGCGFMENHLHLNSCGSAGSPQTIFPARVRLGSFRSVLYVSSDRDPIRRFNSSFGLQESRCELRTYSPVAKEAGSLSLKEEKPAEE